MACHAFERSMSTVSVAYCPTKGYHSANSSSMRLNVHYLRLSDGRIRSLSSRHSWNKQTTTSRFVCWICRLSFAKSSSPTKLLQLFPRTNFRTQPFPDHKVPAADHSCFASYPPGIGTSLLRLLRICGRHTRCPSQAQPIIPHLRDAATAKRNYHRAVRLDSKYQGEPPYGEN
jgi:hypothetical protein